VPIPAEVWKMRGREHELPTRPFSTRRGFNF
jgi:hypothetical protein